MANKSDRAAIWMAVTAPHNGQCYWLNVSFRAPEPHITYRHDGSEIIDYPIWINPKNKAILIAQTVKNWLRVLGSFETNIRIDTDDNIHAIHIASGLAIENELMDADDDDRDNEIEPLVSVWCGWSKPKPAGANSELTYNGSPYTFTVTSSTVPDQLVGELEAMARAHKALMKNEPDTRTTPQPEQTSQPSINNIERPQFTPPTQEMRESLAYKDTRSKTFTPPMKPPPINNEEIWQGILSKADEKSIEASDIKAIYFEVERSQWKSGKSKAGHDYTVLEFFGEGCQYAYPFNIWPNTKTEFINEGFDLLPAHGGHMDKLIIKVTISRPDTGKIYWNVKEVYKQEDITQEPF